MAFDDTKRDFNKHISVSHAVTTNVIIQITLFNFLCVS